MVSLFSVVDETVAKWALAGARPPQCQQPLFKNSYVPDEKKALGSAFYETVNSDGLQVHSLIDGILKRLTSLEPWRVRGRDLDGLTSARITALTRRARFHGERTKAYQ